MSLATRCPHCGTAFKLVRDQLLLHRGWVRCGRCGEAFNAADHRFEIQPPPEPQPSFPAAIQDRAESTTATQDTHPVDEPIATTKPFTPPSNDLAATPKPGDTVPAEIEQTPLAASTQEIAPPASAGATHLTDSLEPSRKTAQSESPLQLSAFAYAPPKPMSSAVQLTTSTSETNAVSPESSSDEVTLETRRIAQDLSAASDVLNWSPDESPTLQPEAEAFNMDASSGTIPPEDHPDLHQTPSAPWTKPDLPQPDSLDIDLATFSPEAEAVLRGEMTSQPRVDEGEDRRGPVLQIASEEQKPSQVETIEAAQITETTKPVAPLRVPPPFPQLIPDTAAHLSHTESETSPVKEQTADAAHDDDAEFDLGAVLHYQFEPEPPEVAAKPSGATRHGLGSPEDASLAAAPSEDAPHLETSTLPEPQFVRQARSQERWQQPMVRALLVIASLILVALGGVQAAWTWHNAIAARWPQTRPALVQLCQFTGCALGAPRRPQDLIIDTSAMSPATDGHLQLTATLRNRSGEAVAYPALELTLTGQQEQIVVRKVIEPAQYLALSTRNQKSDEIQQRLLQGLAPGAELDLRLNLSLNAGQANGYTLYAFYP